LNEKYEKSRLPYGANGFLLATSNFDLWGGRAKGPFEKSAPWNPQNLSDKRIKHSRDELQILICW
jgi:hypothetical protein